MPDNILYTVGFKNKKRARIEIQPRLNPISYEKPPVRR